MPLPSRGGAPLFDTHCHLTAAAFDGDRDEVLARARAAGVTRVVTVASSPGDAVSAVELAADHPGLWATAGVHPHEAEAEDRRFGGALRERLVELLELPEVVAVGECGLDYHYDHSPRALQRRVFDLQIELAAEVGLPLVIHARDADEDVAAALLSAPPGTRGVVHCFTGSDALLDAALERDLHVSFTGIVSFGRYDAAHQVRRVPAKRLMVETDAPYLAPVPHRGDRNEPARVRDVAAAVARHRSEEPASLSERTTRTALAFYGLTADAPVLGGAPDGAEGPTP